MPHNGKSTKPAAASPIDAGALLAWYDRHARNLPWRVGPADRARGIAPDPYRVWLSEIMLQQTSVAAVAPYLEDFLRRWPTVSALAAAPREAVLAGWAGLGYYARARNLHACAKAIVTSHRGAFPRTARELAELAGIGAYTSAAIAAICYDEPVAVVDGNVERVVARLIALDGPVLGAKAEIRAVVGAAIPARAGDFAQALMDLGATVCTPKSADCQVCPLAANCAARKVGTPLAFPVAARRAKRPRKRGHAFVIERQDGAVWLQRRPEVGMLAAMTGTPGSDWTVRKAAPAFPVPAEWRRVGPVRHVFTHFELALDVWQAKSDTPPRGEGHWAARRKLAAEALPTLYRKVLEKAGVTVDRRR